MAGADTTCTFATHFHATECCKNSIHCECPKTMRDQLYNKEDIGATARRLLRKDARNDHPERTVAG
jgi:hypothetical protein